MVASCGSLVFVAAVAELAGCSDRGGAVSDAATIVDAAARIDATARVDAVGLGDASADAPPCSSTTVFTPVTVTGTSPGGSLDGFHYAFAGFVTGFCPTSYLINVTPDQVTPFCALVPWLQLAVYAPFNRTGTHRASASLPNTSQQTDNVSFEATELDPADATPPHIVGHFVSHDPAWAFDIAIDLTSQSSTNCI
jgi:hypothetical protein